MAVASDVRVVRCPKCENLLPELPDFSLYQCGGCGAVLKAKKNGFLEDGLLKISEDVEGIRTSEAGDATNVSQVPMESADLIERGRVAYIHNERVASIGSSMSQAESADVLSSSNARKKGKGRMRRREDLDDEYSSYSQGVHNRYEGRNGDLKVDRTEYVNVHSADTFNNIRPPVESLRSRPFTGTQGVKSKGHSSYNTNYYYEQGDRRRFPDRDRDGLSRVEESENGRAELLRKLDELKDQLSRSCEVTERSKGRIGTNQRMDSPTFSDPYPRHHAAYLQDGVTSSHGENKQQLRPDDITAAYLSQNPGFVPYRDGYGPSLQDSSYPLRGHPYEFQGSQNEPSNPNYHHHLNPLQHGPRGYSSGDSRLHTLYSQQPLTSNSTDVDSENELNHQRPRKVVLAHRSGQFPPTDLKSNSGESEKLLGHLSSTLSISEDEKIRENLSAELQLTQLTEVESFQHPDFPSSECPENCYDDVVVSRFDKGNKSKRSEVDQSTSEHNSVNNPAVATEMDMSLNEFSNSCVSQDSMDNSGEAHPMVSKGTESFFTGLIKKGFKDFTKSKQNVKVGGSQVFVNGHLIPDHLVKKAEKLAGAVQPGEYWYDIQAGFWGVMGHPCLGIVMPNIEEFNYPMPENCAAGNTGVFVNGRDAPERFRLACSRGLPKTRHKSYLIEISGKVVDQHTQEELDSLGNLPRRKFPQLPARNY
ncbi:UNVERIFIED_CONTAM: hypothetical protein Sradi_4984700 [Sesamum radiatum]|uniref:Enhanced disease resistance 4-like N-terminal domain-containing protein n=1 Tax=Sesamum radiatum TaxID=300843 RepID=A0AAW2MH58_SESRA